MCLPLPCNKNVSDSKVLCPRNRSSILIQHPPMYLPPTSTCCPFAANWKTIAINRSFPRRSRRSSHKYFLSWLHIHRVHVLQRLNPSPTHNNKIYRNIFVYPYFNKLVPAWTVALYINVEDPTTPPQHKVKVNHWKNWYTSGCDPRQDRFDSQRSSKWR